VSGETYQKRYAGGFVDLPSQTTAIDSQFLNAVEQALVRLLGADPGNSTVPAWSAALSRFVFQLLTNASVDPAAAIARSKLDFGAGLVDGDLAAGANIAQSKIAGSVLSPTIVDAKGDLIVGQVDNVAARLGVGTNGQVLTADSAQTLGAKWATPLSQVISIGTSLPATPNDGDVYILTDSLTVPTYTWFFRYVAGITDAYKWICIGGAPALVEVAAADTCSSSTYAALTNAGPSFTVVRAGIYQVAIGFTCQWTSATNTAAYMSYDIGATAAVDADAAWSIMTSLNAVFGSSVERERLKTFATASTALVAKYKWANSGNFAALGRFMRVAPVRVA